MLSMNVKSNNQKRYISKVKNSAGSLVGEIGKIVRGRGRKLNGLIYLVPVFPQKENKQFDLSEVALRKEGEK